MSYVVKSTSQFESDLKLAKRQGCDLVKLNSIIQLLREGKALPPQLKDHPLKGEYAGCRECHIKGDWLLVYRVANREVTLYLMRLGSHSHVFGI